MNEVPCPVCHLPMPEKRSDGRPRFYCSWRCSVPGRVAAQLEVDEVVVDRLCLGYKTTSTKAERIEAVRDMTEHDLSASWIAMSLRMTPRTIQRYRAISRLPLNQKAA